MKKLILSIIIMTYLISFVSAQATLNERYDLTISCSGFNCSSMNITILYPNSSIFVNNQRMTNNLFFANYSITPNTFGIYKYYFFDGTNQSKGELQVTNTGNILNIEQGLIYLLVGFILIILLIFSLYGAITIPLENIRNTDDQVLKINWKKYLKFACFGFVYLFIITLVYLCWNLVYAYSQWYNLSLFFKYLYSFLIFLAIAFFPSLIVFTLYYYINDKKISEFIKRTGLPYG